MDSLHLPRKRSPYTGESLSAEEHEDSQSLYKVVKAYEKAYENPAFIIKKIKERDSPIYSRWCSEAEKKVVDEFLMRYVCTTKEEDAVDGFILADEISIVFPTVETMDLFQMINGRRSYKSPELQWSGHAGNYSKMMSELDPARYILTYALKRFFDRFDEMNSLVQLLDTLQEFRDTHQRASETCDSGSVEAKEAEFLEKATTLKNVVYSVWLRRVEDSVSSLGDMRSVSRSMCSMTEYRLATGVVPYELKKKKPKNTRKARRWLDAKHKIPDPYSIVILRNRRDNSYVCWNYRANTEVSLLFDQTGIPFDTKLVQLLKAEYTYAALFKKQTGAHLTDGYILAEEKSELLRPGGGDEDEDDDPAAQRRAAEEAERQHDSAEADLWKRQLGDLDDNVNYLSKGTHQPQRIVVQGLARPSRLPYIGKGGGGGGAKGDGERGAASSRRRHGESDPAADLVKTLHKQIMTGEKNSQDIALMLRSIMTSEDKHLKDASKRIEDMVATRHKFVGKIYKNLETVTKEINALAGSVEDASSSEGFGVVPIRKMISNMSTSMTSVQDMVNKLETSMEAVGINPNAVTETDMFKEMDTRVNVASTMSISKAQLEMRYIMSTVEKMLDHMEMLMTKHTSSITPPPAAYERLGLEDVALADFDDQFAGVFKGPGEVAMLAAGDDPDRRGRSDEVYAEYHLKLTETNELYKTLKDSYGSLLKDFQTSQMKTLTEVSKIHEYKTRSVDARNMVMVYKQLLKTQVQLNQEGMSKIGTVLDRLEVKVNEAAATRQETSNNTLKELQGLQTDLQNVMATVDQEDTADIKSAVAESDTFLTDLRRQRMLDLDHVSEVYRQNMEQLRTAFSLAETRRDIRRQEQYDEMYTPPPSTPSGRGEPSDGSEPSEGGQTRHMRDRYSTSVDEYHRLKDGVERARARAYGDAQERGLQQQERLDKARIERESAVKERFHLTSLKRYGTILHRESEIKRHKASNGNHNADALTIEKLKPMPRLLIVRDHFRKAKIMPGVPERHMKDLRAALKERWVDFVGQLFPMVTIVDIHGVKTWSLNDESVLENIVLPFMKLRYSAKIRIPSGAVVPGASARSGFYAMCDEFVSMLLLNTVDQQFSDLMFVFKPSASQERISTITGLDHGRR